MPDPLKQTVSATQVAALFGCSPYATRYSLYHDFTGDTPNASESDASERMEWGKAMQPLLLAKAVEDLKLEVRPNDADVYVRNAGSYLGCTRDAEIICPDRGPGALETKCVFDYRVWMERWGGGAPPRDLEMQLQAQMLVGDGATPYAWGVLAVFVCGEMKYFERKPEPPLWSKMEARAEDFIAAVEAKAEPDPFGNAIEDPYIVELWPAVAERKRQEIDDSALAEDARMYAYAQGEASRWGKVAKGLKSKLVGVAQDHEITHLPGATVYLTKAETAGGTYTRKPGVRTTIKVAENDDGKDPFAI